MKHFPALALVFSVFVGGQLAAGTVMDELGKLNVPKPSAALKKVSIKSISLQDIALRLDTAVDNPYPVTLPKVLMDLKMNIEGSQLAKASNKGVQLGAKKNTAVPFDISLKYQDLLAIFKKVSNKEALDMGLDGSLGLPLPIDKLKKKGLYFKGMPNQFNFPFKAQRGLPAVLPDIALRNFKIHQPSADDIKKAATGSLATSVTTFVTSLLSSGGTSPGSAAKNGLSKVDLPIKAEFEMVLSNKAASRVVFEALKYDLLLGKEKFLGGNSTKIENRGKESVVTVVTSFPLKSVSTGIANAIKTRKAAFQLKGQSDLQVPALAADGKLPFKFDHTGNLNW